MKLPMAQTCGCVPSRHDHRQPIEKWHKVIGDPTLGDAILDRLVHNAHKIALKGDSMRKMGKKSGG